MKLPEHPIPSDERLRGNVVRIQAMSFSWMFILIMPVIVPYLERYGLEMGDVFRLQAIFAITVVVLEVPSGYLADLIGRRRCLVIAGFLHGIAFTQLAFASDFQGFAIFEIVAAFAVCLYSGSDVALLYDSLERLGDLPGRRRALGQRLLWMQGGETAASLLGGAIAIASIYNVAVVNAVTGWLPFFLALSIIEVEAPSIGERKHLENIKLIWRDIFQGSRILRLVMLNLIAWGLSTLLAVWAFQGFWDESGVPLAAFGFLWASYNLTVAIVGRVAHRIEDRIGAAACVRWIGALPVIGFLGMATCVFVGHGPVTTAVGILFGLCFQVGRGLNQVVIKDALNTRVRKELRATANSISSLGVRLAFAVLGPALGWMIDANGYDAAFGVAALVFGVLLVTIDRALVREIGDAKTLSVPL